MYNYRRPITAIQEAEADGNPETTADAAWTSPLVTPPFPEYTSGHSTFSAIPTRFKRCRFILQEFRTFHRKSAARASVPSVKFEGNRGEMDSSTGNCLQMGESLNDYDTRSQKDLVNTGYLFKIVNVSD